MLLVCVIVLNLSTLMITFCGLGHCPLNIRVSKNVGEALLFFGILKFAAKQILSAVEGAHARTWLTDMEI